MTARRSLAALAALGVIALSLPSGVLRVVSQLALWILLAAGVAYALLVGSTFWALAALSLRDARAKRWTSNDEQKLRDWASKP